MGVFRTVISKVTCVRCAERFVADVQFKTGDDYEMQRYNAGDIVGDLAVGSIFEGFTDSYCQDCEELRVQDVSLGIQDAIYTTFVSGTIFVSFDDEKLTSKNARAVIENEFRKNLAAMKTARTGDILMIPGQPPIPTTLKISDEHGQFWPLPAEANPWTAFDTPFWEEVGRVVSARLEKQQWDADLAHGRDIAVRIEPGGKIAVDEAAELH